MQTEHNILIGFGVEERDKELFFGPLTKDDSFQNMPANTTWGDILVPLGIFSSKSQARKNGFGDIDDGFTDIEIGKKRTRFTVLKIVKFFPDCENGSCI